MRLRSPSPLVAAPTHERDDQDDHADEESDPADHERHRDRPDEVTGDGSAHCDLGERRTALGRQLVVAVLRRPEREQRRAGMAAEVVVEVTAVPVEIDGHTRGVREAHPYRRTEAARRSVFEVDHVLGVGVERDGPAAVGGDPLEPLDGVDDAEQTHDEPHDRADDADDDEGATDPVAGDARLELPLRRRRSGGTGRVRRVHVTESCRGTGSVRVARRPWPG